MKLITALLVALAFPLAALAVERPAGYQSLDCDPDGFTAIYSELNEGEVLHWNNRTCAVNEDGPVKVVEEDDNSATASAS